MPQPDFRRYAVVVVLALTTVLAGCAGLGFGKEVDKTKDWSARKLYEGAKKERLEGNYETAIDYYQKLEARFPFGHYAQQAQLETAYAYYKSGEPASAIAAADRFIKLYPSHPNLDYAFYIKGLTNFNQGKNLLDRYLPLDASQRDPGAARDAFHDFAELTERFPTSKYAKDARQRMLYLRNNLAKYEIHVADYYMRRGAYVAAANRAKYVIENYQEAPAVPDALVVMAKAYKVMKLDDLSDDALRVLRLNYPEHPGIEEVEELVLED